MHAIGTWNWLDSILAAIMVVSVVAAILKGFVRELIALASLVAGLVVAALGYRRAGAWFDDLTRSHAIALGAGFLVLFLGTLLLGALVGMLAQKLIKAADIEWFDRFLGGLFGLVRGLAIDSVLLMVLVAFSIKPQAVGQSSLAPLVTAGARVVVLAMPADLRNQFQTGFEKFRDALAAKGRKAQTKDP
jgi:membrane protein required for colicin V production